MKTSFLRSIMIAFIGLLIALSPAQTALTHLGVEPITASSIIIGGFLLACLLPERKSKYNVYGAQQVSQYGLRQSFERARNSLFQSYKNSGLGDSDAKTAAQNAVLTRSYLRFEQLLSTTQTLFEFPVLNNQTGSGQAVRATERRLNQQDTFFSTDIAVYITQASSATATALSLETYPNTVIFTGTGAAAGLYALYNGLLRITINNSVIVPALPMYNFLQIPQTQLTAATNSPIDQFDPSAVQLLEPMVNFVGTKNSVVQIVLPGNITGTLAATVYAVIVVNGVLAQNVTLMS